MVSEAALAGKRKINNALAYASRMHDSTMRREIDIPAWRDYAARFQIGPKFRNVNRSKTQNRPGKFSKQLSEDPSRVWAQALPNMPFNDFVLYVRTKDICHCFLEHRANGIVTREILGNPIRCMCIRSDATKVHILYNEQERIKAVTAHADVQVQLKKRTHLGQLAITSTLEMQRQYTVEWHDTIILSEHLEIYAALGYSPTEVQPLQPEEALPQDFPPQHRDRFVRVTWKPTKEPHARVEESAGNLLEAYLQRYAAMHAAPAAQLTPLPGDAALSNAERQGHGTEPLWPTHAYNLELHQQVTISTVETNPEQDIVAPNRYTVQVCQRRRAAAAALETIAQVYRPDGTFVGGLTLNRLHFLKSAYDNNSWLPSLAGLLPGTFEEELARLLLRNTPRALAQGSNEQQASRGSAPATLLSALNQGLSITKERNVSPLAVHFDTDAFWSNQIRDQLFGAFHTAECSKWTGASLANPQLTAAAMENCVRWAIAASLEDDATLTILLLPTKASLGNARWLSHPNARTLDTLLPREVPHTPPDYWYNTPSQSQKTAKGPTVIAINNPQGLELYMKDESLQAAYNTLLHRETRYRTAPAPGQPLQEQ